MCLSPTCQYNHIDCPQELPPLCALCLTPIRIVNENKLPRSVLCLLQANPRVRSQIPGLQLGSLLGNGCKASLGRCSGRYQQVTTGQCQPQLGIFSGMVALPQLPRRNLSPRSWACSVRQGHLSLTLAKDQLLPQSTGIGSHDNPSLETVSAHSVHMHRCV